MGGGGRLNLKVLLFGGTVLAGVLPLAVLGFSSAGAVRGLVIDHASREYELLARGLASEYEEFIALHLRAVETVAAHAAATRPFTTAGLYPVLQRSRTPYRYVMGLMVVDTAGKVIAFDPPTTPDGRSLVGEDYSRRPWFEAAKREERPFVFRETTLSRQSRRPAVALIAPVRDSAGQVIGVAAAALDLELMQTLAARVRRGTTTFAQAAGSDGIAIAHRDGAVLRERRDFSKLPVWREMVSAEFGQARSYVDVDGRLRLGGFATVPTAGWKVWVTQESREIEAEVNAVYWRMGAWALASLIPAMALVGALAWLIARPVRRLEIAATAIGRGDLGQRIPETGPREIRYLARTFNEMAESLRRSAASVEQERALLAERVEERTRDLSATNTMLQAEIVERQRAEAAADAANRAKSEFLSRMSHELRTPLNGILGFAQLLEFELETPEQRDGVAHILRGGRHLLALIDEVLDIARIEAGRLSISLEPVALGEVLRVAVDLVRPQAAARRVALPEVDIGDVHVLADRQRLQQVFLNLLSNAVKYNREAGWVRLAWEPQGADRLTVRVADCGLGIAPELMPRLFMPFDRLGAEQTAVEGTGLGLALSRRLTEAMGGTLTAESTVGEGTTFTVELQTAQPLDRPLPDAVVAADGASSIAPAQGTILYIEDNLANLTLFERLVRRRPGLVLLSAMQGERGLELARDHRPDLIVLDLHLPDIPGTEVLARLRADARTEAIPVVILSADATAGQIARLQAQGVRAYLTKPLDVPTMLRLLDEVFAGHDE